MVIAHVVSRDSSLYERTCASLDREALSDLVKGVWSESDTGWRDSEGNSVRQENLGSDLRRHGIDVVHVYGSAPAEQLRKWRVRWIAHRATSTKKRWFSAPATPDRVLPLRGEGAAPEAVPAAYIDSAWARVERSTKSIGSISRPGADELRDLTMTRLCRFRNDIEWRSFKSTPTVAQLADLDLWVDPATDDDDLDGAVAPAVAFAMPVVATRTVVNETRLAGGRVGQLVRPRDPNETTHAILRALFKPETIEEQLIAARETRDRFAVGRRAEFLRRVYAELS